MLQMLCRRSDRRDRNEGRESLGARCGEKGPCLSLGGNYKKMIGRKMYLEIFFGQVIVEVVDAQLGTKR